MNYAFGIPLVLSLALAGGFVANEWSHGGLSEATGAGHHHMLDYGGYHCAAHDDPAQGEMHMAHMHQADMPMPHDACPGGDSMHGGGRPMMNEPATGMQDGPMSGTGMMP